MRPFYTFFSIVIGLLTINSIAVSQVTVSPKGTPGIARENLDTTCKPCQDFYQFATGGWRKANAIPPEYSEWGTGNLVMERNRDLLHEILLEDAAKKAPHGTIEQQLGDFYTAAIDTDRMEREGLNPIKSDLDRIAAIHDISGIEAEIAHDQRAGTDAPFYIFSEPDAKNSTSIIASVFQGGLSLPERDYYLSDDPHMKEIRTEFLGHVAKMLALSGESQDKAQADAQTIMRIERVLADSSVSNVDLRDPQANYHPMSLPDLNGVTPHFSWQTYLNDVGRPQLDKINLQQIRFYQGFDKALTSISIPDWQTYFKWHLIHSVAPYVSSPFSKENFHFFATVLSGVQKQNIRWKRAVSATDGSLGEALGQEYVKRTFTPAAKARALEMVNNLQSALREDIGTLSWMSPATKTQAIAKLDAFTKKIGYPDKWRDYSKLEINRDSYVGNVLRANEFEFNRTMDKIGKPIDRTEWGMTPPTFNAYYNPQMNEIVFPAGMLQPPYFDPNADDAQNYGAIGSVIGHEMTHGFDDQGAQFDASGNLKEWWTPEDYKAFKERAACIVNQFNGFVVGDSLHVKGELVVGESIADLGGLVISHHAFEKALKQHPESTVSGFTPDQRFFLSYASAWSANMRSQAEQLQTNTDPHPLNRFRVDGPLSNMATFREAFHCKAGDNMVRASAACEIW